MAEFIDAKLTAAERETLIASVRALDLSACDFVGDAGCVDPSCWRCHSLLRPENICTLAKNLAIAAALYRAWQMRGDVPEWQPGCHIERRSTP